MYKKYKNCQSCGMPMKQDPDGGGTNSDGSRNLKFCSFCFKDGAWVNPGMTLSEMKALVKEKLREMGFPGFMAGFFTMNMQKLERWKN